MIHFSLPQLPETEQESGSTLKQSNAKALKPLSILYRKVSWVLFQSAPVFKESINKFGYLVSLPKQLGKNESEREETIRGYTGSGQCQKWRRWGVKKLNIQNHSSLQTFSKGKQSYLSKPPLKSRELGTKRNISSMFSDIHIK